MKDQEFITLLLASKEWTSFECKRANIQPRKLLETIVAFANSNGGLIVLGLEDPDKAPVDKRIYGTSENQNNISEVLKLIDKEIDPNILNYKFSEIDVINILEIADKLAIIQIEKSNDIHSLKNGDTYIRKGAQNIKIGSSEIIRLKYEKGTLKYEDELTQIFTLEDIDKTLLNEYKRDLDGERVDDWQFLKDNGLADKKDGKYYLNKAGILLFGNNPSVLLKTKCGIKITRYYGIKPSYGEESNFAHRPFTIEGPLIYQIKKAYDYFKNLVRNSPPKLKASSFIPSFLIPTSVYQEAITNAVIHRNYSVQNDIQVIFFDDRIEIESPGTYPGQITINNIRKERYARNPMILRTLNRFNNPPNLDIGEGVDRMFKLMNENNLYEPLYFPPTVVPNNVLLYLLNLQKINYWDSVNKFLIDHLTINNKQAKIVTGISDTLKMSRLLKTWVDKRLLEMKDSGYKGSTYYCKPGTNIISVSLSKS